MIRILRQLHLPVIRCAAGPAEFPALACSSGYVTCSGETDSLFGLAGNALQAIELPHRSAAENLAAGPQSRTFPDHFPVRRDRWAAGRGKLDT
jgi:hypothetical protein